MAGFDEDDRWNRVDKEDATAALQVLVTLVPQHNLGQAIDLFTTVHEYIVLAPEPLALKGVSWAGPGEESTNSEGYDTVGSGIFPLDLTGPGEPLADLEETDQPAPEMFSNAARPDYT